MCGEDRSDFKCQGCRACAKVLLGFVGVAGLVPRVARIFSAGVAGLAPRVARILVAGVAGLAPRVARILVAGVAGLAPRFTWIF